MKSILVAGHSGFLGRELCALLRRELPGARLWGASRRGTRVSGVRALKADLCEPGAAARLLARTRPDCVFDLSGAKASLPAPELVQGYLIPGVRLLEAAAAAPWKPRLVLAGSAGEYGIPPRLPVTETAPLAPITGYGSVKATLSFLALVHARRGLDVRIARVFNVLGPGMPLHMSVSSFIRQTVEIERGRRAAVLETGDLSTKRDFVDVSDAARALLVIARRGRRGEAYNVCSGRSVRMRSLVEELLGLSHKSIRLSIRTERLRREDIPDMRGSARKLAALGWRPRVPVSESLRAMLEHDRAALR